MSDKKNNVKEKEINKKNEEMSNEFVEDKKNKNKNKGKEKSVFSKVLNVILWVVLIGWMAICLTDFYNVSKEKSPIFCIKKETTTYDDGTVDMCLGLGYKVYNYKRDSYNAIEFGPFWTNDRSAESN